MVAVRDDRHLATDLESLAGALESLDAGPGAGTVAVDRERFVTTLRTYLIPRFENPGSPLIVVFAGPTGSGKSTLINTLTGRDLSATGSLRPTTTAPLVVTSGPDAERFETLQGIDCEVVTGSAPILTTMVLVDTPDIDSTATDHRDMAESLIDAADVVVFVTSALRYADDVAWQVLRRAVSRGADVVHVLNRATSYGSGAIVDLKSRLRREGLDERLVTINEHHVPEGGQRIPSLAVHSLRRRLAGIAVSREEAAKSTRGRILDVTLGQVGELVKEVARLNEEVDAVAAEVSLSLASRAGALELSGLASVARLSSPPSGWLARRRWRRAGRDNAARMSGLETRAVNDITALVHGDLRSWIENEGHGLGLTTLDGRLVSASAPMIASSLEGSVRSLRRLVPDREGSDQLLVELMAAIKIPYQHFGDLVVEQIRSDLGEMDETGIRRALGVAMTSTSLVDA